MFRSMNIFRHSLCAFLCLALTFSVTAFVLGAQLAESRHEVGQHDRVSGGDSPTTWLGRWNPREHKRAVGLDYAWVAQEEPDLLVEAMSWLEEPEAPESLLTYAAEQWRVVPVRGPPV